MKFKTILYGVTLGAVLASVFYVRSADAIAVTVKRVVFEGPKRAEVITIINNSDIEETYRLGWKHFVMSEEKSLVAVNEEDLPESVAPAHEMIRFSPRRFTLPPRASQQVRLMLRVPGELPDGEYRSHLYIQTEQDAEEFRQRMIAQGKRSGAAMRMLPATSMPVIVRKGNLTADVKIEELSLKRAGETINANLNLVRNGTKSTYGDLDFICNPGAEGEYLAKFVRGISVYSEISRRVLDFKVPLKSDKPACGTILVRYTETDGFKGEPVKVYSEATAPVM